VDRCFSLFIPDFRYRIPLLVQKKNIEKEMEDDKTLMLDGSRNAIPVLLGLIDVEMEKEVQDRATSLKILGLTVENSLASAILDFLRNCCKTECLEMESLSFLRCEFNLYMLSVVYEALSLDLFAKFSLVLPITSNYQSPSLDVLQALSKGPSETMRLKCLHIMGRLCPAQTKVIRDICVASMLETLIFDGIHVTDDLEFEHILRANRNLKDFTLSDAFNNGGNPLSFSAIARCVQQGNLTVLRIDASPFSSHSSERDLNLLANAVVIGNSLRELTMSSDLSATQFEDALSVLLRCSSLEILNLSENVVTGLAFEGIDVDALARDVQTTSSLRWLDLSHNNIWEAEPLFRILSCCPKLETLDFSSNGLKELDFETSFSKPSPTGSCLRKLHLGENNFNNFECIQDNHKIEEEILAVLRANPLLGDLVYFHAYEGLHAPPTVPDNIQHCMDMNWAGRVLLGNQEFPISLWPVVFERIGLCYWPLARKANAIFGLLRLLDIVHEPLLMNRKKRHTERNMASNARMKLPRSEA
jgi:hypothetical protein